MGIGTSLVLIAVGAILKFAVTDSVAGVSLATVGLILIIAGAIGLLISLLLIVSARERRPGIVEPMERRRRYVEPEDRL
jgi:uncharacterized protein DUF6458